MERLRVGDAELAYESVGEGEPVLLIHGGEICDAYLPLTSMPPLTSRYRLITYQRRGYGESSRAHPPFSIADQAADALAILRHTAGERAHVVGHSYGGATGMQLALDVPGSVHSLSLLEPPVPGVPSTERFFAPLPTIAALYEAGDRAGAADAFLKMVCGPDYRPLADANLRPNWFEAAQQALDTLFQVELPALPEWQFGEAEARRISQPVLSVLGGDSDQFFVEGDAQLRRWIPQAEQFVLPKATHGLQFMNPEGMADGLLAFLAKHPMRAGVTA